MDRKFVERVALKMWTVREAALPERVRRGPDAIDRATDAWAGMRAMAEAAIREITHYADFEGPVPVYSLDRLPQYPSRR